MSEVIFDKAALSTSMHPEMSEWRGRLERDIQDLVHSARDGGGEQFEIHELIDTIHAFSRAVAILEFRRMQSDGQ